MSAPASWPDCPHCGVQVRPWGWKLSPSGARRRQWFCPGCQKTSIEGKVPAGRPKGSTSTPAGTRPRTTRYTEEEALEVAAYVREGRLAREADWHRSAHALAGAIIDAAASARASGRPQRVGWEGEANGWQYWSADQGGGSVQVEPDGQATFLQGEEEESEK